MAKGFAIHNAPTDHGGFIPSTQVRSSQMGNLFVRAGDGHFCPLCKCWSTVIKSHDHVLFDDKAVAFVGDKLTCGARIQPQQSHVVGDGGGANYAQSQNSNVTNSFMQSKITNYDEQLKIIFNDEDSDIFNYLNCKVKIGDSFFESKIDITGKTERFHTESEEEITNIEFCITDKIIFFHEL